MTVCISDVDAARRLGAYADSLIAEQRTAKRPLSTWLAELTRQIDALQHDFADPSEIATIQNNLGLILLHARGAKDAAESCHRQIAWAHAIGRADLMLQPIINLARIDRMTARRDDAEAKISIIRDAGVHGAALFAGHPLTGLSAADREFAKAVALVERFQLELPAGPEATERYFGDPAYVGFAASGSALFAEQKLQAGLIHRCPATFRMGQAALSGQSITSFAAIAGQFYAAAWSAEWQNDNRPASRLAQGLCKVAEIVLAAAEPCDHRVLRLVHATAQLSDRLSLDSASKIFAVCERLADRLEDVHISALARLARGQSATAVTNAVARDGYRSLRGVPMADVSCTPVGLSDALDDLLEKLGERMRHVPEPVAA